MQKNVYMMAEAAKKVHVETHVLRYWEDELQLSVARNEAGHRMYTDDDISLFLNIRALKDHGFQLKAIRLLLPDLIHKTVDELSSIYLLKDELNSRAEEVICCPSAPTELFYSGEDKMQMFEAILGGIFRRVLEQERHNMCDELTRKISGNLTEELSDMFRSQLQKEEAHFQQLDELLRSHQKAIKEAAASDMRKKKRFRLH